MNPKKRPSPRFVPGDLVRFKDRKNKVILLSENTWIDQDQNLIPGGDIGLVIETNWVSYEDDEAWEYDIHLPSMSVVTKGWGDYALDPISQEKKKKRLPR